MRNALIFMTCLIDTQMRTTRASTSAKPTYADHSLTVGCALWAFK